MARFIGGKQKKALVRRGRGLKAWMNLSDFPGK